MSIDAARRAPHAETRPLNLAEILGDTSGDRRSLIMRALCRLIVKKGASLTSLSDIAREAHMTVSHLLYYFPSKDALLDELYHAFSISLLSNISSNWNYDLSPRARCQVLADNIFLEFSEPALSKEIMEKIIFEMIAYAVHSPRLRHTQQAHTRTTLSYIKDLFHRTPRTTGFSSDDAAAIVCSLWVGTLVFSYFYKPLKPPRAKALFLRTMLHLAGLDDEDKPTERSKGSTNHVKQRHNRAQSRSTPSSLNDERAKVGSRLKGRLGRASVDRE
jgi:AcrR family transcriptional regulator